MSTPNRMCRHRAATLYRSVLMLAAATLASLPLAASAGTTDLTALTATGACAQTTSALSTACHRQASSDRALAQGVCANIGNGSSRERCLADAAEAFDEANDDCDDQAAARSRLCRALGPGAYDPAIRPADFTTTINNPYYPLRPGTVFTYRGKDSVTTVKVLRRTVRIAGVTCVVVRDTVTVDGKIEEDTLDYFAQDRVGNVWYFGEDTAEYVDGFPVDTGGSFRAGIDGAKPGIVMPAAPKVGVTYRQEFDLGDAEDVARVDGRGVSVTVPFGSFSDTVRTLDTTPLEPDAREHKFYARGVGNVLVVNLKTGEREVLVSVTH